MSTRTNFSIKKGFWQKSKKDISENLNLNKFFKWMAEKMHIAYFDNCCDTDSLLRPVLFNIETGVYEYYNGEAYVVATNTIPNNITAGTGGAISVTNYLTTINTDAGGDAFSLADGTVVGQQKKIELVVDGGGNAVITAANGPVVTMNDAGDYVILQWNGSEWIVKTNFGSAIA